MTRFLIMSSIAGIKTIIRNNKLLNKQPRLPDIFLFPFTLQFTSGTITNNVAFYTFCMLRCEMFSYLIENTDKESKTLQIVSHGRYALKKRANTGWICIRSHASLSGGRRGRYLLFSPISHYRIGLLLRGRSDSPGGQQFPGSMKIGLLHFVEHLLIQLIVSFTGASPLVDERTQSAKDVLGILITGLALRCPGSVLQGIALRLDFLATGLDKQPLQVSR